MDNNKIKNLALSLVKADKEEQVVRILENNNLYENENNWRIFGDKENNFSTTGNQQKTGEAALVEKLINSIDSTLTKDCLKNNINPESSLAPKSITKAVAKFYNIANGKLTNISTSKRNKIAEESIGMICTGNLPKEGKPTYTIFDFGEGQTPSMIPETFMSIGASNKIRIPFVNKTAFERLPTGVLIIIGFNRSIIVFSLIHPKFPPSEALSAILNFMAIFSKVSFSILFFRSLIAELILSFSTFGIIISETKYSSTSFFACTNLICSSISSRLIVNLSL